MMLLLEPLLECGGRLGKLWIPAFAGMTTWVGGHLCSYVKKHTLDTPRVDVYGTFRNKQKRGYLWKKPIDSIL